METNFKAFEIKIFLFPKMYLKNDESKAIERTNKNKNKKLYTHHKRDNLNWYFNFFLLGLFNVDWYSRVITRRS